MSTFDQQRHIKGEKYILENHAFQRIENFIMLDSYVKDFMKGIVILVKVDQTCTTVRYASYCLLVKR